MSNWDRENCPCIEVNGRTVGTFRIVRYIVGVPLLRGVKRGSTVVYLSVSNFMYECTSHISVATYLLLIGNTLS